jgi:predicted DNA-binding antitoxin AbrB/MazE fold protein
MARAFNAMYENGVFRPLEKIRLKNKQRVKLTVIETSSKPAAKPTAKRRPIHSRADVNSHAAQDIIGLFKSGAHDLAKNHDGYLYRQQSNP